MKLQEECVRIGTKAMTVFKSDKCGALERNKISNMFGKISPP